MSKIAIDVVLLPSEEVMDICIEVSKKFKPRSRLNKINCLPHISLAMGVIEEKQLGEIGRILDSVSKQFSSQKLEITKVDCSIKPDGRKSYGFKVKKSKKLKELHKKVMDGIVPLCDYKYVTIEMFNQDDPVEEISTYWVKNYGKKYGNPTLFKPHISLSCKEDVVYDQVPIKFLAKRLALCHLGDHCTCRRILWETTLS